MVGIQHMQGRKHYKIELLRMGYSLYWSLPTLCEMNALEMKRGYRSGRKDVRGDHLLFLAMRCACAYQLRCWDSLVDG